MREDRGGSRFRLEALRHGRCPSRPSPGRKWIQKSHGKGAPSRAGPRGRGRGGGRSWSWGSGRWLVHSRTRRWRPPGPRRLSLSVGSAPSSALPAGAVCGVGGQPSSVVTGRGGAPRQHFPGRRSSRHRGRPPRGGGGGGAHS